MSEKQDRAKILVGYGLLVIAAVLIVVFIVLSVTDGNGTTLTIVAGMVIVVLVFGVLLAFEMRLIERFKLYSFEVVIPVLPEISRKELSSDELRKRKEYAESHPPPAHDAPAFNALTDVPDLACIPGSDPMVPMYLLDKNFRILDWNEAFSLAFDGSMEGRRGQGAIEWVYLLKNFKSVLDHANRVFSNLKKLPRFDKEDLEFVSDRYGRFIAVKRAYQLPDDEGSYAGWLILLELRFDDSTMAEQYRFDLIKTLQRSFLWTEYALSYDQILANSPLYAELLDKMEGALPTLSAIKPDGRVLDLGAGTGNLAKRLTNGRRIVFCLENNRTMLNLLQVKCREDMRKDDTAPGILSLKQDVSSLFGLPSRYFDVVIANNVLYSLASPETCLKEVARVLKPGGEVRVSGPARGFNLDKLFRKLRTDLQYLGKFNSLRLHFERAYVINRLLTLDLTVWSKKDPQAMFESAGLNYLPRAETRYYDGHGTIRVAKKG